MPFDPTKKYGEVFGESKARFYQGGVHYHADGRVVTFKDGTETVDGEAPKAEAPPPVNVAQAAEKLQGMGTAQVKSVFKAAGGDMALAKGKGAKQRMIDHLLANS